MLPSLRLPRSKGDSEEGVPSHSIEDGGRRAWSGLCICRVGGLWNW